MARSGVLVLLALACALTTAARASSPAGSGIVVRGPGGSYSLWVLSKQRGINDVNLGLPAGTSIQLLGGGNGCSVHGSTVFCYPHRVPAGRPTGVFRFAAKPRITQATKLVLMIAGPKATGPPVPVAYLSRAANVETALVALSP
ncbi:MAG TPA: hypothetical protein VGQ38_05275 [Gaiellaceae bacterium]|nr:hypothetical protein [Gaiellaceae bacterium]